MNSKISLQASTFANDSWKVNFLGIDLCQIGQSSLNSEKLVPQRFLFDKIDIFKIIHAFFISNAFFSTHPQCFLTISWIQLQILLRCCLIHIIIIILRQTLYFLYLCPCLSLRLFMSYLCNLFFISSLILIVINHMYNVIKTHALAFCTFFVRMITWMKKENNFQIVKVQAQGVA